MHQSRLTFLEDVCETYALYRCACGTTKKILRKSVRLQKTKSCGCLHKEATSLARKTHGLSKNPAYQVLNRMKQRCYNKKCREYPLYGGRGILVCDGWRTSYQKFMIDMGPKPPNTSIDRIDNDLHYSCGECAHCREMGWVKNCRWATAKEQANNRRSNRLVTAFGESRTLSEWQDHTGVSQFAILYRLNILEWSPERAVSEA